jgi:hypothetical protein
MMEHKEFGTLLRRVLACLSHDEDDVQNDLRLPQHMILHTSIPVSNSLQSSGEGEVLHLT